ncbi:hypothetical protein BEH_07675 [Priestia filamentosa]|uniref:Uncharacterized protein n=1 Tax=Priestia filamentosa TaxID=1402861 RepID=A0A0H4KI66_9BACI|nr:hypothetical protein [Priestia filamentosa]AKO91989.1 hypothetical protein BEH_07675 [Priestia filamentosa]
MEKKLYSVGGRITIDFRMMAETMTEEQAKKAIENLLLMVEETTLSTKAANEESYKFEVSNIEAEVEYVEEEHWVDESLEDCDYVKTCINGTCIEGTCSCDENKK